MSVTQKIIDELSFIYPNTLTLNQLIERTAYPVGSIKQALKDLVDKKYPIHFDGNEITLLYPLLSVRAVDKRLHTKLIGSHMHLFPSLESTNNYAKEHLPELEDGDIILAHEQTAGKGRLGRIWSSSVGGSLAMSIVLKPTINIDDISLLTQLTAASLVDGLKDWAEAKIKWPNDILLGKKKVAGILIETEFLGGTLKGIIIGVGINLNLQQEEIPEELRDKATSIKQFSNEVIDPNLFLSRFLSAFEEYYLNFLTTQRTDPFLSVCRNRSVLLGRDYWIVDGTAKRMALIQDIDASGALIVKYRDTNQTEAITSTHLSIRGDNGYV